MILSVYSILLYSFFCFFIYSVLPLKYRSLFLAVASCVFYGLCDFRFLGLLFAEIVSSFFLGTRILERKKVNEKGKVELIIGIASILFILFSFKYFHFFVNSFNLSLKNILLPLGISYYSFKAISYLADIYLGNIKEKYSFIHYFLYVSFFPHLVAGPITRATEILPQIKNLKRPSMLCIEDGFLLILSGLFKKLVIADRLDFYVNTIFDNPSQYPSMACILATFFFAIQLYCDFAGYSEIAIGLTKLFGIECSPNFLRPYFSYNMREFWRRWHISLSSWLRDYIYIPLGGNRVSKIKHIRNVLCTFIICGLWHGSSFHYFIWGFYHGLLNLVTPRKYPSSPILKGVGIVATFGACVLGWVFFKSNSTISAIYFIAHSIKDFSISSDVLAQTLFPFTMSNTCLAYFLVTLFLIMLFFVQEFLEERKKSLKYHFASIQMFSIIIFGVIGQSSFLYANF